MNLVSCWSSSAADSIELLVTLAGGLMSLGIQEPIQAPGWVGLGLEWRRGYVSVKFLCYWGMVAMVTNESGLGAWSERGIVISWRQLWPMSSVNLVLHIESNRLSSLFGCYGEAWFVSCIYVCCSQLKLQKVLGITLNCHLEKSEVSSNVGVLYRWMHGMNT